MADSPSGAEARHHLLLHETESQLSSLVYVCPIPITLLDAADMSQQAQTSMESMLKMINEIDQSSNGIIEDIEKCKDSALERKRGLEEQKERFQKAAFTVIDMLNNRN